MSFMNTSVTEFDLEEYKPRITTWFCLVNNFCIILIYFLGVIVHRGVYRTFKRLGSRHIKLVVIPPLVLGDVIVPIYLIALMFKSCYYPIKDIIGEVNCHVMFLLEIFFISLGQCHTFYVTLFRYICIFHDERIRKLNLNPRLLGRFFCLLTFLSAITHCLAVLQGSSPSRSLNGCLGIEGEASITPVCTIEDSFRLFVCQSSVFVFNFILASNIPEAFMLYRCFQKIKKGTEEIKGMLGPNQYSTRRRENGMILTISIYQWILEVVTLVVYLSYVFLLYGKIWILDKIFHLYLLTAAWVIHPSFYLFGEKAFRTDLSNNGLMFALTVALFIR